jgi:hypothetical protein
MGITTRQHKSVAGPLKQTGSLKADTGACTGEENVPWLRVRFSNAHQSQRSFDSIGGLKAVMNAEAGAASKPRLP